MKKKIAVVTSLIGAYESSLLDFDYDREKYDFFCYTNITRMTSDTWTMVYVDTLEVPNDNAKSSYYYKWNPHKYLDHDKYDTMIWLDSSFSKINMDGIASFLTRHKKNKTSLFIEKHPSRNTLEGELKANIDLKKDDVDKMSHQVALYFGAGYDDNLTTMVETGLSIRNYKDKNLIKFSELIWGEISPEENTKRDQLVFDYCAWKTEFDSMSLFTFKEKCEVVMFQDHPNRSTHKEKILLVGPWLGEEKYEKQWVDYVEEYLSENAVDKVIVGCRPNKEHLYAGICADKVVEIDPVGRKFKYMIDDAVPRFNFTITDDDKEITELRADATWFESIKKQIITIKQNFKGKFNVFYNYYKDFNPKRDVELKFCLNELVKSSEIDTVYVLVDASDDVVINSKKVKIVKLNHRPKYQDLFEYINKYSGDNDISVIINSDCFFDDDSIRNIKSYIMENEAWVLSRKELMDVDKLSWVGRINDAGSQDAWVFKGKVKDVDANFTMGRMGCDNKVAWLLNDAGYTVLNPSKDVILYHYHTSQIRNYNKHDTIAPPYLLVNSCRSDKKIIDSVVIEKNFMVNPYITINDADEEFYVCAVVTTNVLNEFLLFRYSMRQYHKNCQWILSTDKETAKALLTYPDVECNVLVDEQGSHRYGDEDEDRKFMDLVRTKLDVCRISMERYGYALLMDTDMVMLGEFNKLFFDYLKNSVIDVVASHHRLLDKTLEARVGKYNVGMVIIRNEQFIDEWESYISDEYFFEQKPFELAVDNGDYVFGEFGNNMNVAYWRTANDKSVKFRINSGTFCVNGDPIINAHVHMLDDASTAHDAANRSHRGQVLRFMYSSNSQKHTELYTMITEHNNANS